MKSKVFNNLFVFLLFVSFSHCEAREINLDELRIVKEELEQEENTLEKELHDEEFKRDININDISRNEEKLKIVKQTLDLVNKKIEDTSSNQTNQASKRHWSGIIKTGALITLLAGATAATGGLSAYGTACLLTKLVGTTVAATGGPSACVTATLVAQTGACSLVGSVGSIVGGAIGLEGGIRSVEQHGEVTLGIAVKKTCESTAAGALIGAAMGGKSNIDWNNLLSIIDNTEKA